MKKEIAIILLSIIVNSLSAQNIDAILKSIENNNVELKAYQQSNVMQKLESKADNNLEDPTVSYAHVWDKNDKKKTIGELVVTQSFDFPTLYIDRNKVNHFKELAYDELFTSQRQAILLNAQLICMDIIMLNQKKAVLQQKLKDANELSELYKQRLAVGDANILETNKIHLEVFNTKTETKLNDIALENKRNELISLNGNIPIAINDLEYMPIEWPKNYEALKNEVLSFDMDIKSLSSMNQAFRKQINVAKQGWIPKIEVGYRRNTETGTPFNGIVVGGSIPLFQNRYKTKIAKAQLNNNQLLKDNTINAIENSLFQNYHEAEFLYKTMYEYNTIFKNDQNIDLLKKALKAGSLNIIDYFIEVTAIYQSKLNYIELENQYQKILAEIYKYKL